MTTETMTIHKALCELKTLDARIEKALTTRAFVFANKHSNSKVDGKDIGDVCAEIKQLYQSVNDLVRRRNAIKRAVILSNANTKVTVGGAEYTIAEAIDAKNNGIPTLKKIFNKLNGDVRMAEHLANTNNGDQLDQRADEYIRSLFGNVDKKGASEEIKKVRDDFVAAQTAEIIDPIRSYQERERLMKMIDDFTVNIDSALSVSNAMTSITIEY